MSVTHTGISLRPLKSYQTQTLTKLADGPKLQALRGTNLQLIHLELARRSSSLSILGLDFQRGEYRFWKDKSSCSDEKMFVSAKSVAFVLQKVDTELYLAESKGN